MPPGRKECYGLLVAVIALQNLTILIDFKEKIIIVVSKRVNMHAPKADSSAVAAGRGLDLAPRIVVEN